MTIGNLNIFDVLLSIVSFIIALRAFWLYAQIRGSRVLTLGIAMSMFALGSLASIATDTNILSFQFSGSWFTSFAQVSGFVFIWLSSLRGSSDYLRSVLRWQLLTSVLVIFLLLLAPILPNTSDPLLSTVLTTFRGVACFLAFFRYVSLYTTKESRFSFLMMAAFALFTFGYVLIIPRYYIPSLTFLDDIGDILRLGGLAALTLGYLAG